MSLLTMSKLEMQEGVPHVVAVEVEEKSQKSGIVSLLFKLDMNSILKFCTWNLCLGLANKKDLVTDTLQRKEIGICCPQETKIPNDFPVSILNSGGYNIELEVNSTKKDLPFT